MAYRSSDTVGRGTDGTLQANPAGLAANDYVGLMTTSDASAGDTIDLLSSGLTLRLGGTQQNSPDAQYTRYYDKIAAGGDNLSISLTGGAEHQVVAACFSGRNTTSPRTATNTTQDNGPYTTDFTANVNGVTAASGDDVLVCWSIDTPSGSDTFNGTSYPGAYTEREDSAQALFCHMGCCTAEAVSAGATGTISFTIDKVSGTSSTGFIAYTIAIAAASSPITDGPALVVNVSNLRW